MRVLLITSAVTLAAVAPAMAQSGGYERGPRNTDLQPAFEQQFRAPIVASNVDLRTETLAADLVHPWGIDTLPDDQGFLVTERSGNLRHMATDGTLSDPISGLPDVLAERQGGLLDIALGPDFGSDRMIYWTYAKPMGDGLSATAAARGVLSDDMTEVTGVEDIFVQDPPSTAPMHFGSRLVFGNDGTVFITTGEHSSPRYREFAQHLDKTYGKVIRVNLDGSVPDDNPFTGQADAVDTIWSYGHRNIQGALMAEDGTLWTIEHGPQGGDELNLTEAGKNYGWPVITYGENYGGGALGDGIAAADGMEQPTYFWDPVIAPAGMQIHQGTTFSDWNGDILISSLNPGGVVRLRLGDDGLVTGEERLLQDIGRVRDIEVLEDGSFIILTDHEDGEAIHVTAASDS